MFIIHTDSEILSDPGTWAGPGPGPGVCVLTYSSSRLYLECGSYTPGCPVHAIQSRIALESELG